jgi:hypothetical protein
LYLNIQTGSLLSIKNLMVGSMDIGASFQFKLLRSEKMFVGGLKTRGIGS